MIAVPMPSRLSEARERWLCCARALGRHRERCESCRPDAGCADDQTIAKAEEDAWKFLEGARLTITEVPCD